MAIKLNTNKTPPPLPPPKTQIIACKGSNAIDRALNQPFLNVENRFYVFPDIKFVRLMEKQNAALYDIS